MIDGNLFVGILCIAVAACYYWKNTGLRVVYVGGNLNNGANDGLVYWNCNNDVGNANWNIAARTS